MKTVVIIPTHKSLLTDSEKKSLKQCMKVMRNRTIILVHPQSLDLGSILDEFKIDNRIAFADQCFSSYANYNKTIRSATFYERFLDFDYMLLHELDAFLFKDQLDHFCQLGFDFIGAPLGSIEDNAINYCENGYWPRWTKFKLLRTLFASEPTELLNGGLSLRHIPTLYQVSLRYKKKVELWGRNDDLFWCCAAQFYSPRLKISTTNHAAKFALMINCEQWINSSDILLPMGCHGWVKYENKFWAPHIKAAINEVMDHS